MEELTRVSSHNFELIEAAARQLGGIPCMIGRTYFSDGIPCEKVILIYITFLSSRLLEIGEYPLLEFKTKLVTETFQELL